MAMMSEPPSSTPRIGRNESARYSKKLSSQWNLPRTFARSAALISASVGAALPPAIAGRFMMSL